jgi:hypothetical protein
MYDLPQIAADITVDNIKQQTSVEQHFLPSQAMIPVVKNASITSVFTKESFENPLPTNKPFANDESVFNELINDVQSSNDSITVPEILVEHEQEFFNDNGIARLQKNYHLVEYASLRLKGFTHHTPNTRWNTSYYTMGSDILLVAFMCGLQDIYKSWYTMIFSELL